MRHNSALFAGVRDSPLQEVRMEMKLPRLAIRGLVVALAIGAGQAFAADAKQVADAVVAAATANGQSKATYESATARGGDITITKLTMTDQENQTGHLPSQGS